MLLASPTLPAASLESLRELVESDGVTFVAHTQLLAASCPAAGSLRELYAAHYGPITSPEGFDALWSEIEAAHPALCSFLGREYETACTYGYSPAVIVHPDAPAADLAALAFEGPRAAARIAFREGSNLPKDALARKLLLSYAMSTSAKPWIDQLGAPSADPETDLALVRAAIAADTCAPEAHDEAAAAAVRLAAFLLAEVLASPSTKDEPTSLVTSELHLDVMEALPPGLRIALVRPGGTKQKTFRHLLAAMAARWSPEGPRGLWG